MRRHPIVILSILAGGCSGDPELTAEDFKAQYPEAYCAHLLRCCGSDERSYGSSVVCQEQIRGMVQELLGFTASETPFARFLPEAARSCLDRLRDQSCDDLRLIEPGCAESTVQPQQEQGQECTYSAECKSYYCYQEQKLVRGSCGQAGSTVCSGDDRACSKDNYCQGTACQAKKSNTQLCGSGRECESGICGVTTKTCQPRPTPFCGSKS